MKQWSIHMLKVIYVSVKEVTILVGSAIICESLTYSLVVHTANIIAVIYILICRVVKRRFDPEDTLQTTVSLLKKIKKYAIFFIKQTNENSKYCRIFLLVLPYEEGSLVPSELNTLEFEIPTAGTCS